MEKYLRVTMTDGSQWDIPASVIAADRAKFYAEQDTGMTEGKKYDDVLNTEFAYSMGNEHLLFDWAEGMDWESVRDEAVLQAPVLKPDYSEDWINGRKEIIEK